MEAQATETSTLRHEALSPGEVRLRIREEHHRLRRQLVELQELAQAVSHERCSAQELRRALHILLVELSLHLDSEDEILLPLVERVDAWGSLRAARMRAEHETQRAILRRLFARACPNIAALRIVDDVEKLVVRLLRDMTEEEAELLGDDLLRDDIVALDQTCG